MANRSEELFPCRFWDGKKKSESCVIVIQVFPWSSSGCFNYPPKDFWHTEKYGSGARRCTTQPPSTSHRQGHLLGWMGLHLSGRTHCCAWVWLQPLNTEEAPRRRWEAAVGGTVCKGVAGWNVVTALCSLWWNHSIHCSENAGPVILLWSNSIDCRYFMCPLMWILILITLDMSLSTDWLILPC